MYSSILTNPEYLRTSCSFYLTKNMAQNHVLIVGSRKTKKLTIVKDIFGVSDFSSFLDKNAKSHAGLIISNGKIVCKYYTADINIFVDEVQPTLESYDEWLVEFQNFQMKELRDSIQGIILTLRVEILSRHLDQFTQSLQHISDLLDSEYIENHTGDNEFQWSGFKVVVGIVSEDSSGVDDSWLEKLEEKIPETGFDFVIKKGDSPFACDSCTASGSGDELKAIVQSTQWPEMRLINNKRDKSFRVSETTDEFVANFDEVVSSLHNAKNSASHISNEDEKSVYVKTKVAELLDKLNI